VVLAELQGRPVADQSTSGTGVPVSLCSGCVLLLCGCVIALLCSMPASCSYAPVAAPAALCYVRNVRTPAVDFHVMPMGFNVMPKPCIAKPCRSWLITATSTWALPHRPSWRWGSAHAKTCAYTHRWQVRAHTHTPGAAQFCGTSFLAVVLPVFCVRGMKKILSEDCSKETGMACIFVLCTHLCLWRKCDAWECTCLLAWLCCRGGFA
jgi:hypothetical protein